MIGCVFTGNKVTTPSAGGFSSTGSAIAIEAGGTMVVRDCIFNKNDCTACVSCDSTLVVDAASDDAVTMVTISNVTFHSNLPANKQVACIGTNAATPVYTPGSHIDKLVVNSRHCAHS